MSQRAVGKMFGRKGGSQLSNTTAGRLALTKKHPVALVTLKCSVALTGSLGGILEMTQVSSILEAWSQGTACSGKFLRHSLLVCQRAYTLSIQLHIRPSFLHTRPSTQEAPVPSKRGRSSHRHHLLCFGDIIRQPDPGKVG